LEDPETEIGMFKDIVQVVDRGFARLRTRAGEIIADRVFSEEKSVIQVKGWVSLCLRERGKIVPGSRRDGHNIWTNTGREYLALLMSLQVAPATPFRTDSVAFIGMGTGSRLEEVGVLNLLTPVAYAPALFLAALDTPPTFPLTPSRTTVRYKRTFLENEITLAPGTVNVSEMGLYTNGSPTSVPAYNPTTRDTSLVNAASQAPVAYKTFEPVPKTDALELEISWEIRF
jgi:hypothetical protein